MELNARQQHDYYQNLIDAGCEEATAKRCMELLEEGKQAEMIRMLTAFRGKLLDTMHVSQKQIDCLDYFFYRIKKENIQEDQ